MTSGRSQPRSMTKNRNHQAPDQFYIIRFFPSSAWKQQFSIPISVPFCPMDGFSNTPCFINRVNGKSIGLTHGQTGLVNFYRIFQKQWPLILQKLWQDHPVEFLWQDHPKSARENPLAMTNSSPWYRWPIEIDGLPNLKMVIFHGYVK